MTFLLLLLLCGTLHAAPQGISEPAIVIVPIADVWSEPSSDPAQLTDDKRETQILFGEKVLIHESSGAWIRIEAEEQPEFTHHKHWEGYPGWTLAQNVGSFKNRRGSREAIVEFAEHFVGRPYLWGGMSGGIDCSGLVHLAYRFNKHVIPRDAFEQAMKATPIKRAQLKKADLIFSSKIEDPKKITHVSIYSGDGEIIEAPQAGLAVRKISFKEKYGKPLEDVESGDTVGERVVYFGSFLEK